MKLGFLPFTPHVAFAQGAGSEAQSTVGGPVGIGTGPTTNLETSVTALNFFQKDLGSFITPLVETALIVGSILVLMYLLWGGIDWIMSSGDKAKYEGARSKITAAVLGLAIMASAWAVWLFINYFLGIDLIIKPADTQPTVTSKASQASPSTSLNLFRRSGPPEE
jgi:hypothetical protein